MLTDLAAAREALTKSASEVELRRLAMEASQGGSQAFTVPAAPVAVGSLCRIFYDRSKGPLPASSAKLVFKVSWQCVVGGRYGNHHKKWS